MSLPKLATLAGLAGVAGMSVGCVTLLLRRERDNKANKSNFLLRAVELLKEQPVTKELLGDNLKIGRAKLDDGFGSADKFHVKIRLPIQGELDSAYLYAYARRKEETERLRLYKLEATFAKVKGKRLILLDRTDQEDPPEEVVPIDVSVEAENQEKAKEPDLTPEEKKRQFKEQMKNWAPVR